MRGPRGDKPIPRLDAIDSKVSADELKSLSNQLDEQIKDVEDFLVGLRLGVPAQVQISEEDASDDPDVRLTDFVAFRRGKDGWGLMCLVVEQDASTASYREHAFPLVEASRDRKIRALMHLQELILAVQTAAADQAGEIRKALEHAKLVMANTRGEK